MARAVRPQPNVPALLAALERGEAEALKGLREAEAPESAGAVERYLRGAVARADAADGSGADAAELLLRLEPPGCGPALALALGHPNAAVRDAAARAIGELRFFPAAERLKALRSDAALAALETMFQRKFYGSRWADWTSRPRRTADGRRDWTEFDAFWDQEGREMLAPPLLPEECTPGRMIADYLDRLPGSHRVLERHGFRCVARIGRDLEECVAVEKESLEEGARLHGKELAPLLADLRALAGALQEAEPPPVDEVETVDAPPPA